MVSPLKQLDMHAHWGSALILLEVGGREDSAVYIRMKIRAAEQVKCGSTVGGH